MKTLVNVAAQLPVRTGRNEASDAAEGFIDGAGI
jgi:hypothetical protein